MSRLPRTLVYGLCVLGLGLGGCGGGGGTSASSGGGGTSATNVYGTLGTGGVSNVFVRTAKSMLAKVGLVNKDYSGCVAYAYNLNGANVLAQADVDGVTGAFEINSAALTPGVSYKIVTICGSEQLASVIGADNSSTSGKTPGTVNANSALITMEVIDAIITAVTNATNGISDPTEVQTIENAVLKPSVVGNLVSNISATIETAIAAGTMPAPTASGASNMAAAIALATSGAAAQVATAVSAYKTDSGLTQIPPAVASTVSSSASTAAAFRACDNTLPSGIASAALCTQAMALFMNNIIHFDVALLMGGSGAFGTFTCDSAGLGTNFPNATFVQGGQAGAPSTDASFCFVHNTLPAIDRNQSYAAGNGGGGGGGGPLFGETGGTALANGGVLTALGTALYSGYTYHLSDIDNLVFTAGDGTSIPALAGMNGRLVYLGPALGGTLWPAPPNGGGNYNPTPTSPYLLSNNGGTTAINDWPTGCAGQYDAGSGVCVDPNNSNSGFTWIDNTWAVSNGVPSAVTTLIGDIGSSTWVGSVFLNKFGGPVPDEQTLIKNIVNATTFTQSNRTGAAEFFVIYQGQPNQMNSACQWGSTPPTGAGVSTSIVANVPASSDPNNNVINGVSATDIAKIATGQPITGTGIPSGSYITSVNNWPYTTSPSPLYSFTISNAVTGAGTTGATVTANSNAVCLAQVSGNWEVMPSVTVDVTMGPADSTGLRPISTISVPSDPTAGHFYVYPVNNGIFTGLVQFVDKSNGAILLDDNFNPRYVQIVMYPQSSGIPNQMKQCNTAGIPSGCTLGDMYNVAATWTCSGNCTLTLSSFSTVVTWQTKINTASAPSGETAYVPSVPFQPVVNWQGGAGGALAARYAPWGTNANSMNGEMSVYATLAGNGQDISGVGLYSGAVPAGKYAIQLYQTCTSSGCSNAGYILVDPSGAPLSLGGGYTGTYTGDASVIADYWQCNGSCTEYTNVALYSQTYLQNDIGSLVLNFSDNTGVGTAGTLFTVTQTPNVAMGPAFNPTYDCTLDPYFVDIYPDHKIHTNGTTCLQPTFGSSWTAGQWVNDSSWIQCVEQNNSQNYCADVQTGSNNCKWGAGNGTAGSTNTTDSTDHSGEAGYSQLYTSCPPSNFPGGYYTPVYTGYSGGAIAVGANYANIKALMKLNNSNGFQYGDAKSVTNLMHMAFGPMLDGKHTLSNSTPLNAIQTFGLVYLYFTGGGNQGTNINNIYTGTNSTNQFETEMGVCNGNGGTGMGACNSSIGLGLLNFKQP